MKQQKYLKKLIHSPFWGVWSKFQEAVEWYWHRFCSVSMAGRSPSVASTGAPKPTFEGYGVFDDHQKEWPQKIGKCLEIDGLSCHVNVMMTYKTLMDWRCVCFSCIFCSLERVPQWFLIEGVVTRSPVWNNHGFQRDKFLGQKKCGIHKICNRARSCLLGKNWLIECQLSMMSAW